MRERQGVEKASAHAPLSGEADAASKQHLRPPNHPPPPPPPHDSFGLSLGIKLPSAARAFSRCSRRCLITRLFFRMLMCLVGIQQVRFGKQGDMTA